MSLIELLIVILILAWLLGTFAVPVGGGIHALLLVVLLLFLLRHLAPPRSGL